MAAAAETDTDRAFLDGGERSSESGRVRSQRNVALTSWEILELTSQPDALKCRLAGLRLLQLLAWAALAFPRLAQGVD